MKILAIAALAVLSALPVAAQTACLPRAEVIASLGGRFGETLAGGGLQSETRLIEVWRSTETGTFSVVLTRPDGMSCILAAGMSWHDAATTLAGDPA